MKRVIPGLALAGCWFLLLLKGPFLLFWLAMMLVAYQGGLEFTRMAVADVIHGGQRFFFPVLFVLPVIFAGLDSTFTMSSGLLISFIFIAAFILYRYANLDNPYKFFSSAVLGLVYVGFLTAHLVLLHQLENGNLWIIVLTAITAGSDTGAYYSGRLLGRHKLCPAISPKKTIEGAVGGLAGGLFCALFFSWLLLPQVNYYFVSIGSLVLVVVGIGGDLTESVFKRAHGIKDSGKLLAGHGGILDRTDSILFAAPVLYYFLLLSIERGW